jgi:hypothetical protein
MIVGGSPQQFSFIFFITGWRWSRHLNFLAQGCGDATPLLKITEFRRFRTSQAAIVNNSILNDQSTVDTVQVILINLFFLNAYFVSLDNNNISNWVHDIM